MRTINPNLMRGKTSSDFCPYSYVTGNLFVNRHLHKATFALRRQGFYFWFFHSKNSASYEVGLFSRRLLDVATNLFINFILSQVDPNRYNFEPANKNQLNSMTIYIKSNLVGKFSL